MLGISMICPLEGVKLVGFPNVHLFTQWGFVIVMVTVLLKYLRPIYNKHFVHHKKIVWSK